MIRNRRAGWFNCRDESQWDNSSYLPVTKQFQIIETNMKIEANNPNIDDKR